MGASPTSNERRSRHPREQAAVSSPPREDTEDAEDSSFFTLCPRCPPWWRGLILFVTTLALGACSRRVEPDAYGNVEATEVVVGAEASGRLVSYR